MKKNNETKEVRMFAENFRAIDDEAMTIEGYALKFESPATHGFTEVIDKNALNNTDMRDVPMKYNHSDNFLIMARTRNNSLRLTIDDIGLKVTATLIDTSSNRDVYKAIKSGLLDKMSFAFTVSDEEWDYESDTRRILGIDRLYDVSVVDVPFYDSTSIYARALSTLESGKKQLDSLKLCKLKNKYKKQGGN